MDYLQRAHQGKGVRPEPVEEPAPYSMQGQFFSSADAFQIAAKEYPRRGYSSPSADRQADTVCSTSSSPWTVET